MIESLKKEILMKKVIPLLVILVLPILAVVFSDPAEGIQTSSAVQVPEVLKTVLSGVLLAGVMLGLQVVFDWIGLDLRGVGAAVAAALSGFAIAQLQGYIDAVPAQYDYLVTIALNILVVILTGLGSLRLLTNRERGAALLY